MFKYWGFGMHIASEMEFPELLPFDFIVPDVIIKSGNTPDSLEGENVIKRAFSYIGKDEYLLKIKNICTYYTSKGRDIIYNPCDGIDEKSIRLFLLGTVMAAVLYHRGRIPLHGSAIVKDGKLIVFVGNSGVGKSTLSAHLAIKGYELFTDDICIMQNNLPSRPGIFGTASYPMMKLWKNTIAELNNDQYNIDYQLRPQLPKYGQFFFDGFIKEPLPLGKIFILNDSGSYDKITVSKIENAQIFKKLVIHSYRRQFITNPALGIVQFSLLTQIASEIPVYEVKRSLIETTVDQLCNIIEQLF